MPTRALTGLAMRTRIGGGGITRGAVRRCGLILALEIGALGVAPLQKRGPGAWENYDPREIYDESARLVAHAVTTDTAKIYIPHVQSFLAWADRHEFRLQSPRAIDWAVMKRLDLLRYG